MEILITCCKNGAWLCKTLKSIISVRIRDEDYKKRVQPKKWSTHSEVIHIEVCCFPAVIYTICESRDHDVGIVCEGVRKK